MEYTVQKLAKLAGVSTRTLRYYDEINLLQPARINSSGYRIYGEKEVNQLQHILFYRELGFQLEEIKKLIFSPSFNRQKALKDHHAELLEERARIDSLIQNVEKTIHAEERNEKMRDEEKFKGFKKELVEKNERKYGAEIRQKYGEEAVEDTNQKVLNMTKEQYEELTATEKEMFEKLKKAFEEGDPKSEDALKAAELHKKWLQYYWSDYSKEAHAGLGEMYVSDERFKRYYDQHGEGLAEFLRQVIYVYTGKVND
ncbi:MULTISPECIES: MerR family transcriptional regulator [Bacillus]|uniref:MerR family transcriptional regulator n=1 Tax=Bacillus TaxID=1386 RepID=UPI0021E104A3|nr:MULTISPECIES: MerR family transcriptional regulator [Bacillus]MCV0024718.1 MerR family transcriptional regulator [Bacillus sp. XT-2]WOC58125.1 MerR family transcriptional regulator [Bacillus halotolerans]